jgi:hypothetical protein
MSGSGDDPAAAGSPPAFSEEELALIAELEEDFVDDHDVFYLFLQKQKNIADAKPSVVHLPDVPKETRVVHLPHVWLTASEVLESIAFVPSDACRHHVVQWCEPSLYLQVKLGKQGHFPLFLPIIVLLCSRQTWMDNTSS